MKNFIFKSSQGFGLIKNILNKLDVIQSELRHQRQDHVTLQHDIEAIRLDLNLKRQAETYYEEHALTHTTHPTSHQTDLDEQNEEE